MNIGKLFLFIILIFAAYSCKKDQEIMTDKKKFKLSREDIKPVAEGFGACFASNMITMEGKRINFMYREKPDNESDSGWRFLSGHEPDEYANNPKNINIFDINTIANYDPDIIPFLNYPVNSAFERNQKTNKFEQVFDFEFHE